jgi:hypothetical protein
MEESENKTRINRVPLNAGLGAEAGFSIIRNNLMNDRGYTPYCGEERCFNRTKFDGEQFKCSCGWRSKFPNDFIAGYKAKWHQAPNV